MSSEEEKVLTPELDTQQKPSMIRLASGTQANEKIWESVVKIFCSSTLPWFVRPWSTCSATRSYSTGFFIRGHKILCNAHGVTWATTIRVRKRGSSKKYDAKVLIISHECDLAVLEVDSKSFWKDTEHLEFGTDLVRLLTEIVVIGYPMGGDSMSLTKGVVSRIGVLSYPHGYASLPFVQTDAAINPGNSGGPAVQDGKVVGVAFCGYSKSHRISNIGYLIPIQVIEYFLQDVYSNAKEFRGFGELSCSFSISENPSLREFFHMPPEKPGVVIRTVPQLSSAYKLLQVDDVLLKIGDHVIGNDGNITLGFLKMPKQQVSMNWVVALTSPKQKLTLSILRKGKEMTLVVPTSKMDNYNRYFPWYQYDQLPTYYVWAGLTFIHYTNKIKSLYPKRNIEKEANPESNEHHVVICPTILDHPVNQSYSKRLFRVTLVNGIEVYSVRDVMELIESTKPDDFVRLEEREKGEGGVLIIIKKSKGDAAQEEIKKRYKILSMKSADLLEPCNGKLSKASTKLYYRQLEELAEEHFQISPDKLENSEKLQVLQAHALSSAVKLGKYNQGDGNLDSLLAKLREMKYILDTGTDL